MGVIPVMGEGNGSVDPKTNPSVVVEMLEEGENPLYSSTQARMSSRNSLHVGEFEEGLLADRQITSTPHDPY